MQTPFYDPAKTYEENNEKGPFGEFADEKISLNKYYFIDKVIL